MEMAAFRDMIGERFTCDEIRIAMMEVKADLDRAGQKPTVDRAATAAPRAGQINAHEPKKCVETAHASYCYAVSEDKCLAKATDGDVYEWLKKNAAKWLDDAGYTLPSLHTWERYVRAGRQHHKVHKNTPRAARPHGTSIVPVKQIEYRSSQSQDSLDEDES